MIINIVVQVVPKSRSSNAKALSPLCINLDLGRRSDASDDLRGREGTQGNKSSDR